MENNKGQMGFGIIVGLLLAFMVIAMLITLIPAFVELIDGAQASNSMNCYGYVHNGDPTNPLSYNATVGSKSTMGCLALKMYIPYIVIAVLIGLVMKILYDKGTQQPTYGYG